MIELKLNGKVYNLLSYPVIDFMHMLYLYGNYDELKDMILERGYELDKQLIDQLEEIKHNLSTYIHVEIEELSYLGIFDCLLIQVLSCEDAMHSIDDFFNYIHVVDQNMLFKHMSRSFLTSYSTDSSDVWGQYTCTIDESMEFIASSPNVDNEVRERYLSLLREPDETLMRLKYVLKQFYQKGYSIFEVSNFEKSKKAVAEFANRLSSDEAMFMEVNFKNASIMGSMTIEDYDTDFVISYVQQYGYKVVRKNHQFKTQLISIGVKNFDNLKEYDIENNFDKFLKIIADPTRFKIITCVGNKEWYVHSLAKELSLTPATIHYHLETLSSLSIVHANKSGNKILYTLNVEVTKLFLEHLSRMILKNSIE